jgi:hypothetical protein
MPLMRKTVLLIAVTSALLAVLVGAAGTGKALAYGSADQPIAQVEISGNCDNPSFLLCAPEPAGVGTGGVWAWAELDTAGNDNTHGGMDFTFSGCGHTVGGIGGPGGAGGHGGPGQGIWYTVATLKDETDAGAFPFFDPSKYTGPVYVLDFFPGAPPEDDFIAAVPVPQGHYGWQPANGVTLQTQVAP